MDNKHRKTKRKNLIINILSVPLFALFSYTAIRFGMFAGNFVFNMDSGFIRSMDTENFKVTMNKSIPLIETVYNSGKVDVSVTAEVGNLIRYIFGFDLNTPLTILNSNSPLFSSYYHGDYSNMIAQREAEREKELEIPGIDGTKPEDKQPDGEGKDEPGTGDGQPSLPEAASSIAFEETEEKDVDPKNVVSSGKITVQNQTKYKIDEAEITKLLKEPLKFKFDKKKNKVLIYHTHTTESYVRSQADLKNKVVPAGTRDSRYNVVRVGDELRQQLEKKFGIDVLHNGTIHDAPYNSSYSNSLKTMSQYMKSYPNICLLFDIHRDGLKDKDAPLRVVKEINGKNAAQIMFVVGTNSTGLNHPAWKENLKLAIKLQERLNEIAPGLAKPILISKNRYNHHISPGTMTIEVGGNGNLMSEALESIKYLAQAVNDVIK